MNPGRLQRSVDKNFRGKFDGRARRVKYLYVDWLASRTATRTGKNSDPVVAVLSNDVVKSRSTESPPGISFRAVAVAMNKTHAVIDELKAGRPDIDERLCEPAFRLCPEF